MIKCVRFLISIIGLFGLLAMGACKPKMPIDMETYIEEIKKAGITQKSSAQMKIWAEIFAGNIQFDVSIEPGRNGVNRTFSGGSSCPRMGSDPEEFQDFWEPTGKTAKEWFILIKQAADRDQSGFVSNAEGSAFYRVMEIGLCASKLPNFKNVEELGKALELEKDVVKQSLLTFAKFQNLAAEKGLKGTRVLPRAYLEGL